MQTNAICWIASMTKPITATAVLMLQDEGKLSVDDPVAKYLPELGDLKTADGKTISLVFSSYSRGRCRTFKGNSHGPLRGRPRPGWVLGEA
jgi:hypothetical protein